MRADDTDTLLQATGDIGQEKNWPLGAHITLTGAATSVTENMPVQYTWFGPFGIASGPNPSVFIPEGIYSVTRVEHRSDTTATSQTMWVTVRPAFDLSILSEPGRVQLIWPGQGDVKRYDIYRAHDAAPGNFRKVGESPGAQTTYVDETGADETTYLYTVASVKGSLAQGQWRFSAVAAGFRMTSEASERPNEMPVVYSTAIEQCVVEMAYCYDVNAADPDNDLLRYELKDPPEGMGIDNQTGLITWIPKQTGVFTVDIRVADGRGAETRHAFILQVLEAAEPVDLSQAAPVVGEPQPEPEKMSQPLPADSWEDKKEGHLKESGVAAPQTEPVQESPKPENRPPELFVDPLYYEISAGQTLVIHLTGVDPDGDEVTLSVVPDIPEVFFNTNAGTRATGTLTFAARGGSSARRELTFTAKDPWGVTVQKTVTIAVAGSDSASEKAKEKQKPPGDLASKKPSQPQKAADPVENHPASPRIQAPDQSGDFAAKKPYTVQVSSMLNPDNAQGKIDGLIKKGYPARLFETVDDKGRRWYTVRFGDYADWESADKAAKDYRKKVGAEALVVVNGSPLVMYKAPAKVFAIRMSSFQDFEGAKSSARTLAEKGYPACVVELRDSQGRLWHITQIGTYPDRAEAEKIASRFKAKEKGAAEVVSSDPFLLKVRTRWCPDGS